MYFLSKNHIHIIFQSLSDYFSKKKKETVLAFGQPLLKFKPDLVYFLIILIFET